MMKRNLILLVLMTLWLALPASATRFCGCVDDDYWYCHEYEQMSYWDICDAGAGGDDPCASSSCCPSCASCTWIGEDPDDPHGGVIENCECWDLQ